MDNFQKVTDAVDELYTAIDNLTRQVYESDDEDLIASFESHMEEYSEPTFVLDGWDKVLNELWHDLGHMEKSHALEKLIDEASAPKVRISEGDLEAEEWWLDAYWKGEHHFLFATSEDISFFLPGPNRQAKREWPDHIGDPRLAVTFYLLDNWEHRPTQDQYEDIPA